MKSPSCQLPRPNLSLLLLFVALAAVSALAQASPPSNLQAESGSRQETEAPSAYLSLDLDRDGPADVTFTFDSRLASRHNFAKILSAALGCPLEHLNYSREDEYETTVLYAQCHLPLHRTFFTRNGEIDLQPLKDFRNVEASVVLSVSLSIPHYDVVSCDPASDSTPQDSAITRCIYMLEDPSATPRILHFRFGYDSTRTFRRGCVLGFLLLIPIALTFWFRRRALSAPEDAKPTISFAYRRFLTWTVLLGALAWWTAIDLLHAGEFIAFLLPSANWNDAFMAAIFPWVLLWFPPAIVYFLCLALSSPMDALRGTKHTQSQVLGQSFWAVARFMFPISLLCFAIAEISNSPRIAVLLFAGAIVMGRLAQRRFARAYGLELHALTSGELRDRAFAIAQKAGAKLTQLYVLPAERIRMANAFAHVANNIYLTDYLVKNMSKREVDAVIGHEVAHLQKKHIRQKMAVAFVAILVFAFGVAFLEYLLPSGFPSGPIFYAFLLLAIFFVSRRNEFAADAGAAKLTGDAEAMITALAKLSRLNTMPMHWGKLDEKLLTHPSTLRRIKQLARTAGISEARISELLSQSAAPPTDVYSIPATALPAGKVFSTQYKSRLAGKYAWIVILTTVTLPAIVALAAQWASLGGTTLWFAYLLGLVLTLAFDLALANFLPMLGLPDLERLLREKCGAELGSSDSRSGLFVSLAPDSTPRIYEGNWAWDLGILSVTPDHLSYCGEEARFVLRRAEITLVSLGPGPAGWFKSPSLYVSWCDAADREGIFNVRPLCARSMRAMATRTLLLARDLENWHRGLPSPPDPFLAPTQSLPSSAEMLGAPVFGQVTSMSPRSLVRGKFLVRDLIFNTLIAVGVITLFGLGFPFFDFLVSSSESTNTTPTAGASYVLAVVWITRLLLLTPYWRIREKKSLSGSAAASPKS